MTDNVNNPSHYQGRYGMESIDALRNFMTDEQMKGFYLGNSLKYILRHQKKNGLEDLKRLVRTLIG
nr:MAG TPA: nucelotide kinase [Caudoviricetes sp.]